MSVIRINKNKNYVTMSNYHFKEKNMSLKAKGLLSEMLSLPENWNYTISGLVAINKENESAIKSTLNELKEFGYLKITKIMPNESESGRIEYIYDIYENPKQEGKKQGVENQPLEIQPLENQVQYNINNKNINNKIINNKKEITKEKFETFYSAYPKKVKKADVEKWFIKHKPSDEEFKKIMQGLENYQTIWKDKDKQFIPYPTTWLNGRQWEDEIERKKTEDEIWKEFHDELVARGEI